MTSKFKTDAGLIGRTDPARRERLMELADLIGNNQRKTVKLRFPDWSELQRDLTTTDLPLGGPNTVLFGLSDMLAEHSQLLRSGVPMIRATQFADLDVPIIDRTLEAVFGGSSVDVGDGVISAALPKPKRLSAFVVISRQLRVQNPLLSGAWLEAQLMAAMGRALDKAAIVGDGTGENPVGFLNDPDVLTHERASAGANSLADLCAMEEIIANANGNDGAENLLWIADTATRSSLRQTAGASGLGEVFGEPVWEGSGPFGYDGIASVHCPTGTLALAQKSSMAFFDWGKLEVENLLDVEQAKEGFQTVLVNGYFDFAILDPNGVCVAVDPA